MQPAPAKKRVLSPTSNLREARLDTVSHLQVCRDRRRAYSLRHEEASASGFRQKDAESTRKQNLVHISSLFPRKSMKRTGDGWAKL